MIRVRPCYKNRAKTDGDGPLPVVCSFKRRFARPAELGKIKTKCTGFAGCAGYSRFHARTERRRGQNPEQSNRHGGLPALSEFGLILHYSQLVPVPYAFTSYLPNS
jgi:hypothetical protein